jgi:DNA-binding protein WhiA
MNFTAQIKNELARLPLGKVCCQQAELMAFLLIGGSFSLQKDGFFLQLSLSHAASTRRAFRLEKAVLNVSPQVLIQQQPYLRKNKFFLLRIPGQKHIKKLLYRLGLSGQDFFFGNRLPAQVAARRCCRCAYLRGAFLAGGSLSRPESGGYHLEIITAYERQALSLVRLLNFWKMRFRSIPRKNHYVVYSKNSETIGDFLRLIGAHASLLRFESARVYKGFRSQVNRLVNCETANLTKTVNASQSQVQAIRYLQASRGWDNLSPGLRQVAQLRLQYPEASLAELGCFSVPPLSKSCINHRLRRLRDLARNLHKKSGSEEELEKEF